MRRKSVRKDISGRNGSRNARNRAYPKNWKGRHFERQRSVGLPARNETGYCSTHSASFQLQRGQIAAKEFPVLRKFLISRRQQEGRKRPQPSDVRESRTTFRRGRCE